MDDKRLVVWEVSVRMTVMAEQTQRSHEVREAVTSRLRHTFDSIDPVHVHSVERCDVVFDEAANRIIFPDMVECQNVRDNLV